MPWTTTVNIMCRVIDFLQWTFILGIGATVNTFDYQEDIHGVLVTIIGMAAGTLISHFIKKWLNKPNCKNDKT